MTGHLTAQAAQEHNVDMIHAAERHRRAHAELLDRLDGRWLPFRHNRSRAAVVPALVTDKPCP